MIRIIFVLVFLFMAFWLVTSYFIKKRRKKLSFSRPENLTQQQKERIILTMAKDNDHLITAIDVAANSDLSIDEAEEILRNWTRIGYADLKISDSGKMIYQIGFFDEKDKNNPDNFII